MVHRLKAFLTCDERTGPLYCPSFPYTHVARKTNLALARGDGRSSMKKSSLFINSLQWFHFACL